MLSKIEITNFKSIESLTLDMSFAEGKAPNRHKESDIISFLEPTSKPKDRIVSIMNIYGANASGKSNIIHSLFCFQKVLTKGVRNVPDFFSLHKLKDLGDETRIQLYFFLKKKKYQYTLAYNRFAIQEEKLLVNNKELFSIKKTKGDFKGIEMENFDNENLKKRFEILCVLSQDDKKRQINTFLSSIVTDLPGLNADVNLVFRFLENDFIVALHSTINPDFSINHLAESNNEKDIKKAFERISDFIKRLDIDIERFQYDQKDEYLSTFERGKNEYQIPSARNQSIRIDKESNLIRFSEIKSFHKNEKGEEIAFEFQEESLGTRLAFGLIGTILRTLDKGGVFIVDEIDKSLHPLLLQSLMRVFKDKEYNKNNAQLISTIHNTDILDDNIYKMSEFSFVNKNLKQGTFIKRLSDFEGMRNAVNFRDRYLDGLYSGIPYPYN